MTERRAWYFYDWANSAFYTTVVVVFLGPYLTALARNAADADGNVYLAGIPLAAQSVWPYAVSFSVFLQLAALPLTGALADYTGRKREMLGILAFSGAAATTGLFFAQGSAWMLAAGLFVAANVAFGASIVVYNAFLPELASAAERDGVSSKGWAFGYLGSGLLLGLNLLLYARAASLGISEGMAVRISLTVAGLWWAGFTLIPVLGLRNRTSPREFPAGRGPLGVAFHQLRETVGKVRRYRVTLVFLAAYLIYNDAIQTVIAMAVQFGSEELKLGMGPLTGAALLTQFVAFGGALLFDRIARVTGNRNAVMLALVAWVLTLVYVYAAVHSVTGFYVAAGLIGTILGGSQALSRSIYSFLIPKGEEAEYFSIYEISDKGTSWLGHLFFGLMVQYTRSYRVAILSLIVFFAVGLVLLARVDVRRGAVEAGNPPPAR